MFYYLNDNKLKNNTKKNYNPYKIIFNQLITAITSTKIDKIIIVNNLIPENRIEGVEEFVTWIKESSDKITPKDIEHNLKKIYITNSFEKLMYVYISTLNVALSEDFILNASRKNNLSGRDVLENYDEFQVRKQARTVIATICLYAIIVSEDLLNKRIHRFDIRDNYKESRVIKEIKSEHLSIMKGVNDLPIILTQKEADLLNQLNIKFVREGHPFTMFEHLKLVYTHRCLEYLISMYCFGSNFDKFFEFKEFINDEGFRIQDIKFYPVPCDVLNYRRLIPPDEGVVIRVLDHDFIDSLYLNECTRFNFRFIYGVIRFKDGFEQPYSLRIHNNPFSICFAKNAQDLVSIVCDFYQIPQTILEIMQGLNSSPKYEILPADIWKYRNKDYKLPSKLNTSDIANKNLSPKITTYVRKTKGNASKETLEFAHKLQLKLLEHETLVKERDRGYNRF